MSVRPRPVKSVYSYHDADIADIVWTSSVELRVRLRLYRPWQKDGGESALVHFMGVRNRTEVESQIEVARSRPAVLKGIDGFLTDENGYRLGPLAIRCRTILEI